MSKTIELQIEKSRNLIDGLRKHVANGQDPNITNADIEEMESNLKKLVAANEECDRLRAEVSAKVKNMNAILTNVKDAYLSCKRNIKGFYPQEQWADYGVPDKR